MTSITFDEEVQTVNSWLKNNGVNHNIYAIARDPSIGINNKKAFLELWEHQLSGQMRCIIIKAICECKLNIVERNLVADIALNFIKKNSKNKREYSHMSILVTGYLAQIIKANKVHDVGKIVIDESFGKIRAELTYVLRKIGTNDAVSYLLKVVKDPVVASLALEGLAILKADKETLSLCKDALNDSNIRYKDAIEVTYSRLSRKLSKKKVKATHITKKKIPSGLFECSMNIDGDEVATIIQAIWKCFDSKSSKKEIDEIKQAISTLAVDQQVRLKFQTLFKNKKATVWLEVFCDDEYAYELYLFSSKEIITQLNDNLGSLLRY